MKQKRQTGTDRYPRRLDHVVWKVIDGKGILLNLEDGSYFEVGRVGLAIWQHCDGKTTFGRMTQSIARDFRAREKRVTRDLQTFVAELKRRKLAEVLEEPKAATARV